MSDGVTIDFKVHFTTGRTGARVMHAGEPAVPRAVPAGRVPRISKLMALAIRFEELVRSGEVADFADVAELGQVTRARVSQIVNLLNLAPDIQEAILYLPPVAGDRDAVPERRLRAIAAEPSWVKQREAWQRLTGPSAATSPPRTRRRGSKRG